MDGYEGKLGVEVIMLLVWVGRVNIQYMSIYLDLW
jgi:hypothetical protein